MKPLHTVLIAALFMVGCGDVRQAINPLAPTSAQAATGALTGIPPECDVVFPGAVSADTSSGVIVNPR